jgi:hypothetical protein
MNWELPSRVRCTMTRTAVAVALLGLTQTGMAGPANATPSVSGSLAVSLGQFSSDAPTGPDDPLCIQMPTDPVCQGGPYWQGPPPPPAPPIGPLDPSCISNPADAACVGSPFLPPPPPPPPVEMAPPPPPIEAPPPVEMAPPPIEAPPPPPPPVEMPISPPPMVMPSAGMGGMPGSI